METQGVLVISRDVLGHDLEVRSRLEMDGDNRSSNFYPVQLTPWTDPYELKILPKARAEIIGKENLLSPLGNSCNADQILACRDDVREPCFCFESPSSLGQELIHAYDWERIVHLTAGNGWLALAGLKTRVPGVYICFTEAHRKALQRHLTQCVFMMKQDSKQKLLYDPYLVSLLEKVREQLAQFKELTTPQKDPDPSAKQSQGQNETPKKGKKKAKSASVGFHFSEEGEPPKKAAKKASKKKGK